MFTQARQVFDAPSSKTRFARMEVGRRGTARLIPHARRTRAGRCARDHRGISSSRMTFGRSGIDVFSGMR